jgi:putative transposase
MRRAYKFRLWTTRAQEQALEEMLDTLRRKYNADLAERKAKWREERIALSFREQRAQFKIQRRSNPYYAKLPTAAAYMATHRVDRAFQHFFALLREEKVNQTLREANLRKAADHPRRDGERPGYPRFKGRLDFNTIEFQSYPCNIKLIGKRLRVFNVGTIKVNRHRPIHGVIKTASIRRELGKWYAIFSCDFGERQGDPSDKPPVGIDVGITRFFTTSDEDRANDAENPRFLKEMLPELRRAQQALSRKKTGGSNRRKARANVARLQAMVSRRRLDFHHKQAFKLLQDYGVIFVEDLGVHEMLGQRKFSQQISDAGWRGFLDILKSKAEEYGALVIAVDPRGTTQECSGCGQIVPKTIRDRWHSCSNCGLELDRDENAARNILRRGMQILATMAEDATNHRIKSYLDAWTGWAITSSAVARSRE